MIYLYKLLKYSPPARKIKYKNIMSKKDILKELENYIFKKGHSLEKEINEEEEEKLRDINDKYYNKFDKYWKDNASGVRYYFLDDPFKTIIDIIIIYDKSESNDITNNILIEL